MCGGPSSDGAKLKMAKPESYYQQAIREELAKVGMVGAADPRHIEGYMRLEHPTLNGLSSERFTFEVGIGLACVRADGVEAAERNARSFGL